MGAETIVSGVGINNNNNNNNNLSQTQIIKFPYVTRYEHEILIARRAVELSNDAEPLVGICRRRRCAVRKTQDNANTIIPMVRFTADEKDLAEMEFSLGALDDYDLTRNDGSATPIQVRVGNLWKKDGY